MEAKKLLGLRMMVVLININLALDVLKRNGRQK